MSKSTRTAMKQRTVRIKSVRRIRPRSAEKALLAFVECIDMTGGIRTDRSGFPVPAADEEWIDLGVAYLLACRALKRDPSKAVVNALRGGK